MTDTIVVDHSPNRATINGLVVPESDGVFIITLRAKAQGNGHGQPVIWSEIFINGRSDKKSGEIVWADGIGGVDLTTAEPLQAGKDYTISGISGNRNADSVSLEMEIRRAG